MSHLEIIYILPIKSLDKCLFAPINFTTTVNS